MLFNRFQALNYRSTYINQSVKRLSKRFKNSKKLLALLILRYSKRWKNWEKQNYPRGTNRMFWIRFETCLKVKSFLRYESTLRQFPKISSFHLRFNCMFELKEN